MEIQIKRQQGLYRKMEISQRRNKEYSQVMSDETETSFNSAVQEKAPDYNEKAFESLAPNAPEEVRNAWMEAARETGVNGMGSFRMVC